MKQKPQPPLLYRDAALADARSAFLRLGVSVLVDKGRISWIRSSDDEGVVPPATRIIEGAGATIVPGMVDAHSHLALPGGSRFADRGFDDRGYLMAAAEDNGELLTRAGIRWARDVGAPVRDDPTTGRRRAVNLSIRDAWRERPDRPHVRAAGGWVSPAGFLPSGFAIDVHKPDQLMSAAQAQLDDGADLVKLMLDGPKPGLAPWSINDVAAVVTRAHSHGAKVAAHATDLAGARVAVHAGVDSIEHGLELDDELAGLMAARGIYLVTTLSVYRSWRTFARTTADPSYASPSAIQRTSRLAEMGAESVRIARRHGVKIAAGTDFGGGSPRANHLAWEVEALVEAGMEPWEALAAATWRGGELLDESSAGVIEVGGRPDFFLVHGDPLSDPASLWRVWRVGWA